MTRILTTDIAGGVTETFAYDAGSDTVVVRRSQDVNPILDYVANANLAGVNEVQGLGRPAFEVPVTVAIEFCEKRGIPWEKFLYSNDYDSEWTRFGQEYQKLAYQAERRRFAVSG